MMSFQHISLTEKRCAEWAEWASRGYRRESQVELSQALSHLASKGQRARRSRPDWESAGWNGGDDGGGGGEMWWWVGGLGGRRATSDERIPAR